MIFYTNIKKCLGYSLLAAHPLHSSLLLKSSFVTGMSSSAILVSREASSYRDGFRWPSGSLWASPTMYEVRVTWLGVRRLSFSLYFIIALFSRSGHWKRSRAFGRAAFKHITWVAARNRLWVGSFCAKLCWDRALSHLVVGPWHWSEWRHSSVPWLKVVSRYWHLSIPVMLIPSFSCIGWFRWFVGGLFCAEKKENKMDLTCMYSERPFGGQNIDSTYNKSSSS